ncbi:MAG: response regulator [Pseudomonadota bacterium]
MLDTVRKSEADVAERPRICLIDDDPLVRDALALGLEDAGFVVQTAEDAKSGLALVSAEMFDVAVIDMNMPTSSGADLAPRIRATRPDLAIVAISGASEIGGRSLSEVAREIGADACLLKPFRAREIAALLQRLLAAKA